MPAEVDSADRLVVIVQSVFDLKACKPDQSVDFAVDERTFDNEPVFLHDADDTVSQLCDLVSHSNAFVAVSVSPFRKFCIFLRGPKLCVWLDHLPIFLQSDEVKSFHRSPACQGGQKADIALADRLGVKHGSHTILVAVNV